MIDLHNHVLPGVDDGAANLEMALRMLSQAAGQGITHVACTPHGNDRATEETDRQIQSVFLQLRDAAAEQGIGIDLALGCEIMLGIDILRTLQLPFATYQGAGKYFLLEFPWQTPFEIILNAIKTCTRADRTPVIAHYERYERALKTADHVQEIRATGAVITLDAGSLVGQFGPIMNKRARQLLSWNLVDILASDAHNDTEHGFCLKRGFETAVGIVGEIEARKMVWDNPKRVWDGMVWPRSEKRESKQAT